SLVRWDRSGEGQVAPAEFVPYAELTGQIVPVGEWVLSEACRQGAFLQQAHARQRLTISVNMSARQLTAGLAGTVGRAIESSGLQPSTLCLELTETAVMADVDACGAVLRDLRSLGVRIALDDFGTGHSTLQCLHTLPI